MTQVLRSMLSLPCGSLINSMRYAVIRRSQSGTGWGELKKVFLKINAKIYGSVLCGKHDNVKNDGVEAMIAWLVVEIIASWWCRKSTQRMQSWRKETLFDQGLARIKLITYLRLSLQESRSDVAKRSLDAIGSWFIRSRFLALLLEKLNNFIFITASDPTYSAQLAVFLRIIPIPFVTPIFVTVALKHPAFSVCPIWMDLSWQSCILKFFVI